MTEAELLAIEEKLREQLGTRVRIERNEAGGKILIDFFSNEDLRMLLELMETNKTKNPTEMIDRHIAEVAKAEPPATESAPSAPSDAPQTLDDRTPREKAAEENEDIYSVKDFSI